MDDGDLCGIDADEGDQIAFRLLGVGDDRSRTFYELERDAEQLQRNSRDRGGTDTSGGERQQDHVMAGDERAPRVEVAKQVTLAVVDDVDDVRVQPADEPRIHGEAADVCVDLRPHGRAGAPRIRYDAWWRDANHVYRQPPERVAKPVRVQPHARLLIVTVVV